MFSHSNLFWFFFSLSINGNSTPYISSSKSGSVSGFLVLSHTFQNVQSCISNHSVPQITVSLVRQTAHNMHVACIASCIHVTKNSNNALPLLALRCASHMHHNIQWVRDIGQRDQNGLAWHSCVSVIPLLVRTTSTGGTSSTLSHSQWRG